VKNSTLFHKQSPIIFFIIMYPLLMVPIKHYNRSTSSLLIQAVISSSVKSSRKQFSSMSNDSDERNSWSKESYNISDAVSVDSKINKYIHTITCRDDNINALDRNESVHWWKKMKPWIPSFSSCLDKVSQYLLLKRKSADQRTTFISDWNWLLIFRPP